MKWTTLAALAAVLTTACSSDLAASDLAGSSPRSRSRGEDRASGSGANAPAAPAGAADAACAKMDVLFVVSNANGMTAAQNALGASVPAFIAKLDAARVDYRIAVTSSDTFAPDGQGRLRAECGAAADARPWLAPGDADIAKVLACRAKTGATSCIDRPLQARTCGAATASSAPMRSSRSSSSPTKTKAARSTRPPRPSRPIHRSSTA